MSPEDFVEMNLEWNLEEVLERYQETLGISWHFSKRKKEIAKRSFPHDWTDALHKSFPLKAQELKQKNDNGSTTIDTYNTPESLQKTHRHRGIDWKWRISPTLPPRSQSSVSLQRMLMKQICNLSKLDQQDWKRWRWHRFIHKRLWNLGNERHQIRLCLSWMGSRCKGSLLGRRF